MQWDQFPVGHRSGTGERNATAMQFIILIVAGARANFLKVAPIITGIRNRNEAIIGEKRDRAGDLNLRCPHIQADQHRGTTRSGQFFHDASREVGRTPCRANVLNSTRTILRPGSQLASHNSERGHHLTAERQDEGAMSLPPSPESGARIVRKGCFYGLVPVRL
jgi:hypothetical protein